MANSRKIAFRAWDKKNKKMIYFNKCELLMNHAGLFFSIKTPFKLPLEFDYLNLMLYTGLKDENEKKIYEGDIVKCIIMFDYDLFSKPINIEVKFKDGEFTPMTLKKMTKYRILSLYYSYEVIGNIYQDSHLLNK